MPDQTDKGAQSVADFIAAHRITMEAKPAASNPNADADAWSKEASHWLCILEREGAKMVVPFSQGAAHRQWKRGWANERVDGLYAQAALLEFAPRCRPSVRVGARVPHATAGTRLARFVQACSEGIPPGVASVLDCLASDAASYDNARNFEDWCAEFGMDTDSRKAERMYHIVGAQAKLLRHFLGNEAYETLLFKTERM